MKFRISIKNIQRSFTPNHQVTHTPKDSRVKSEGRHVGHTNNSRENIKRIEPISVGFKRNIKHDEKEFYRQLKDQEAGLNKLTVKEYMDNREKYIKNGRDIEAKHYQKEARNKVKNEKLEELLNQGFSKHEAKARVNKMFRKQAALHNPDMIAGEYAHNIGGLGDKNINSSLGSQWKYRIDDLDFQIYEQSKKFNEKELEQLYLNISLN
ncbi:hypothetical protein BU085_11955 [Staphylococcus warneri]|uniref:Novel toxin 15 domain-containing protein n=1 Tax=Staphylococcus warneri TaxID=1292 RepID=A0A2T4PXJ8_STAWA|nr:hypothetical protein BU085_11955 [Staphylococcus warneri]